MPDSAASRLTLRLFGAFEARRGDVLLPRLRTRKGQWLLALLALRPGAEVERAWLAGVLWPDSPEAAALTNLRSVLKDLRRTLGAEAGRLRSPTTRSLSLDMAGADLDVRDFDAAIARGDPDSLRQAVDLYRGPLLEDCREEWAFQERQAREEAYLGALETLATQALADQDAAAAERCLRRAVALDPLRESAQRALMQVLAAGGSYAAALLVYRELRQRLHREINAAPDAETTALYQQLRAEAREKAGGRGQGSGVSKVEGEATPRRLTSPGFASARRHNLPLQLTSFIGREAEMKEAKRLLTQCRLLTFTGAGGCGKTRLSLQFAAEWVAEYLDGVWLVELASLSDERLVPQAVVSVLGLREEPGRPMIQALIDYLGPRQLLLVLDNCEHLIAACAALADSLLRHCPHLRILASSREPLRIAGETTYRVPSLPLPDPRHLPPAGEGLALALTQYEAVQLFIDRVTSTLPAFTVTNQNAPAVAEVCYRLDGIPLAIELAAARVKALPIEQLATRLDDRFRLLTGGSRTALRRHQTLRALIDWSYDLLSEAERLLLGRLSVFAGGGTLEAAEAVCAGEGIEASEVLDLLTALVEKSLVIYEEREGQARYRLLETMRQYARDRLSETGEAPLLLQRHQDWFLALAEQAEPEMEGAEQGLWLTRLEREHDNFRAALSWAAESETGDAHDGPSEPEIGAVSLRLAGALGHFWSARGRLSEGRRWLEGALARSSGDAEASEATRAKALTALGHIAWIQGDFEPARARCEEGAALAGKLANKQQLIRSLATLGLVTFAQGDHASARARQVESLALSEELGDRSGIARSLFLRGHLTRSLDPVAARSCYEESLAIFRELGNMGMIAWVTGNLAGTLSWSSDAKLARAYQEEALAIFRELGALWGIARGLTVLGSIALSEWELATAQSHYEEGLEAARQLGDSWGTANLVTGLGVVAGLQGDYESARQRHEEALAIRRDRGARLPSAESLYSLGEVAMAQGCWVEAKALFEEADAIDREHGNREGWAPNARGRVALKQGDFAEARRIFEEDLVIKRELRDKQMVATNLHDLGDLCARKGECGTACSFAKESLAIRQELRDKVAIAQSLELLAAVVTAQRQAQRAARLFGAAEGLREKIGAPLPPAERADHARDCEALLYSLGEEAFAAAWAEGRAMTLKQAVQYALEETTRGSTPQG